MALLIGTVKEYTYHFDSDFSVTVTEVKDMSTETDNEPYFTIKFNDMNVLHCVTRDDLVELRDVLNTVLSGINADRRSR